VAWINTGIDKFIRDNVVASFMLLTVVIVTLPVLRPIP